MFNRSGPTPGGAQQAAFSSCPHCVTLCMPDRRMNKINNVFFSFREIGSDGKKNWSKMGIKSRFLVFLQFLSFFFKKYPVRSLPSSRVGVGGRGGVSLFLASLKPLSWIHQGVVTDQSLIASPGLVARPWRVATPQPRTSTKASQPTQVVNTAS